MTTTETFVLVRRANSAMDAPILEVVRSYESARRAEEDVELLSEVHGEVHYAVLTIPYIDR